MQNGATVLTDGVNANSRLPSSFTSATQVSLSHHCVPGVTASLGASLASPSSPPEQTRERLGRRRCCRGAPAASRVRNLVHHSHVYLEVVGACVRAAAVRAGDRLATLVADLLVAAQVRLPTEQGAAVTAGEAAADRRR